uniref:Uncharacterized protein YcbJ n=1 Tax=Talaromyces marneffei PM1 TaxID=1077442 RepID=A0A093V7A4_TALMA
MFCEASPPIESSILKVGDDIYRMGSTFICEKAIGEVPESAVTTWKDNNDTYYLRRAVDEFLPENNALEDVIYKAGTSSAVWAIGRNVICKVKTWCHGMEMESSTLAFLAVNFPHIPIPDVVISWLDTKLNRTFLLLKRIEGQTLQSAWPSLSSEHRHRIASTIAQYCNDLAISRSSSFQSATGLGVLEPFLNVHAETSHPSWKPRLLGPLSCLAFVKYLQRISKRPAPIFEDTFYFYHADLGPTNILVSQDGEVNGILDWESAAFYPDFWVSLKPYISAGFLLNTNESRHEWVDLFETKLSEIGFRLNTDHVEWYKCLDMNFFDIAEVVQNE